MATGNRSQLIHIEVDRRLGHEWDEWNGKPLPNAGDFTSPPRVFFAYALLSLVVITVAASGVLYLLAPRIGLISADLPRILWYAIAATSLLSLLWLTVIALSYAFDRRLLPARLAERGPYLKLMNFTSMVAAKLGKRDWVENSAVRIYNRLAAHGATRVERDELLILIPRCLSKPTLDGVLNIAAKNGVKAFVATRGQLARRAIKERRPRAIVAVACERDMMTGLRDVAGKVPVLGLTMSLPAGPCKDAVLDLDKMEDFVGRFLKQ